MKTKIHLGGHTYSLPFEKLQEAFENYTFIRLEDGSQILSYPHLRDLEKPLSDFNFFRVNLGKVLHPDHLTAFDFRNKTCQISKPAIGKVTVSRSRKAALQKNLRFKISPLH